MRKVLLALVVLSLCSVHVLAAENEEVEGDPPVGSQVVIQEGETDANIIVYEDSGFDAMRLSLDNLGLSYSYHEGDDSGFVADLASGTFDLAVINQTDYSRLNNDLDSIHDFVLGGGKLIIANYDYDATRSHPLWQTMGAVWQADLYSPVNPLTRRVLTHPIFNILHTVPDLVPTHNAMDNGDYMSALAIATTVAGAPGADPLRSLIIVRNNYQTILNSFLPWDYRGSDSDKDQILDVIELFENQITFVLSSEPEPCPPPPEPNNPDPCDGATDVPTDTCLSWSETAPVVPGHNVVINEVDMGGSDSVELFNPTGAAVDLTAWQLIARRDNGVYVTTFTIPVFTLAPGAYVVLHESSGTNTPTDLYFSQNIMWTQNTGSCALVDAGGVGVDFVRWSNSTGTIPSTDLPPAGTNWTGNDPWAPSNQSIHTLGRDGVSTDTDDGTDWENTSGRDADGKTPGRANVRGPIPPPPPPPPLAAEDPQIDIDRTSETESYGLQTSGLVVSGRSLEEREAIAQAVMTDPAQQQSGAPTVGLYPVSVLEARAGAAVEVLMFTGHSDNSFGGEAENTLNAIADYFTDFNVTQTTTENPAALATELIGKNVFLVPEQERWSTAAMAAFGNNMAATLNSFVANGGLVIVCEHYPLGGSAALLQNAALMNPIFESSFGNHAAKVVVAHPILAGVSATFTAMNGSVTYTTISNAEILVADQAANKPMVGVKTIGTGGVVLLGWDYYSYNTDMARIIANAVQWGEPSRTRDVYLGTDPNALELICEELRDPNCDPTPEPNETLLYNTTYYWQVVAKNECGETQGPRWSFRTERGPNHRPSACILGCNCQRVEGESTSGAAVTLDGSCSTDPDSKPDFDDMNDFNWYEVDCWDPNFWGEVDPCALQFADFLGSGQIINHTFPLGEHTIILQVTDKLGAYDTEDVTIIVEDTILPVITLNGPGTMTLERGVDSYTEEGATAADICDGNVPVVIGGEVVDTSTCGTYVVTYNATDASGNVAEQVTRTVIVQDTIPPDFELSVTPTMLWPPNHNMVLITPSWTASDICDVSPEVSLVGITMNEGDDTVGDGHTTGDIQIGDDGSIYLRAERSGPNSGRIYTITYQAVDDCGNVTVRSATVSIPHDFKVLARIAARWLWTGPAGRIPEDLNGDGIVNFVDFARFAENWIK